MKASSVIERAGWMKIETQVGDIIAAEADTLIVNLFEGVTRPGSGTGAVDRALDGAITEVIASGDFRGAAEQVVTLYPRGAKRIATILQGAGVAGLPVDACAQALVEGTRLGLYTFDRLKAGTPPPQPEVFTIVERDAERLETMKLGVALGEASAAGVILARDLVNLPANIATPAFLAEVAGEIAERYGMGITVGDRAWAESHGMGAFLGVAQGTDEPPRFIVLEHNLDRSDLPTVVLVGKGVTFDSGGLNLKPLEGITHMKEDMAGAAVVLGALQAAGQLELPLRLIGIMPCTDNMPSGKAYHPGDVLTASNGVTIEMLNADAEGRLLLADGLVWAARYQPDVVIDLATLTGSCVIALGQGVSAGLFSNADHLREALLVSATATRERLWPLPLWDDYRRTMDSDIADIKNTGGKYGGVGTSAAFLQEFVSYSWAHLDIAPMALSAKELAPYTPSGATGFGVRLLLDFLHKWTD
jgi:leucyl aminopeptidase